MDDLRRKCFFCKDRIDGKKTLEHIIPNSLLGKLGIKEKTVTGQFNTIQYSRVKVPAHESCNNQFGSDYENRILSLLENPEQLYNQLLEEAGILMMYSPDSSVSALITTWLSKIYYGLFYYDLISTKALNGKMFVHQLYKVIILNSCRARINKAMVFNSLQVFMFSKPRTLKPI